MERFEMRVGLVSCVFCLFATAAIACGGGCLPEPLIRYTNRAYTTARNLNFDFTLRLDSIMLASIVADNRATKSTKSMQDWNEADWIKWRKGMTIAKTTYPADYVPATPEEVYHVMTRECKDTYVSTQARVDIRDPYKYCDCVANAARENSYAYSTITAAAYSNIKTHHYTQCDKYFDPVYTMPEVYSNIYWLCKTETNHTAECDRLALDVRASIVARLDEVRPDDPNYVMYDSEYQALIHHPDFDKILDDLVELCVKNGY